MDEITRATVRIEPPADSTRPSVPVEDFAAAILAEQILGRDDGPPLTLDIATMLDATLVQLTDSKVVIELADERRVDDDAFDALLGQGDIDDFDPAQLESMEAHSGLENAQHEPLPLAQIPELPELVMALLEVAGDWTVTFRDQVVDLESLLPPPPPPEPEAEPEEPAAAPGGPYGEVAARHWATSVVRSLLQSEELELATARDQSAVQTRLSYMLEDLTPQDPIPVQKIVNKLFDMPGVVELYADDDAVLALFEQLRPG